jgi:hypothetical protein
MPKLQVGTRIRAIRNDVVRYLLPGFFSVWLTRGGWPLLVLPGVSHLMHQGR